MYTSSNHDIDLQHTADEDTDTIPLWREFIETPSVKLIAISLVGLIFGGLFQFTGIWLGAIKLLCLSALFFVLRTNVGVKSAFIFSWVFGASVTLGGMNWLFTAMHDIGGLPNWIAGLAMLLFSLLLGSFNGLAGATFEWIKHRTYRFTIPFVATWTLAEWLRTWVLTGMPWMSTGYGFLDTPLTGIAPVFGVLGISAASALLAVCIIRLVFGEPFETALSKFSQYNSTKPDRIPNYFKHLKRFQPTKVIFLILSLCILSIYSGKTHHTKPYGAPLSVSLLQGNIPQSLKFDRESRWNHMEIYANLAVSRPAQLTVMPETAFPTWEEVPNEIFNRIQQIPGTLVVGNIGQTKQGYTNRLEAPFLTNTPLISTIKPPSKKSTNNTSAVNTVSESKSSWIYDKQHLVPFGETIPTGFRWFVNMMSIPLASLSTGNTKSPHLKVADLNIAANICYEEIFAHEWRKRAAQAHVLLNASNFGWYGDSSVLNQHVNIARMRALEFQKPYLSATNNGSTLFAQANGEVTVAPRNTAAVLSGAVQGMSGFTPYSIWGDWGIVAVMLALLSLVFLAGRR
jgi:apolipoprotein N-acyltransferase